jgi:hypothetical protein
MAALASLKQQCESAFTIVPLFDHTKGAFPVEHIAGARAEQYPPNLLWHPIKG